MSKKKNSPFRKVRVTAYSQKQFAMNDELDRYFNEAGQFSLLTREEEVELWEKMEKLREAGRRAGMATRKNGEEARERLINCNLRLVIKIAAEYRGMGLDFADLINEGNMGLMKGVERFNPNKGGKVSTYVSYWIKQTITRALSNTGRTIRLPVHVGVLKRELNKYRAEYLEKHHEYPSNTEAAEFLGVSEPRAAEIADAGNPMTSLNKEVNEDEGGDAEFQDFIADEKAFTPSQQNELLNDRTVLDKVLNQLTKREKFVIIRRFGLHDYDYETLESIGNRYGVTRERIRQVENMAMRKLRFYMAKEMKTK